MSDVQSTLKRLSGANIFEAYEVRSSAMQILSALLVSTLVIILFSNAIRFMRE
jgi:hypothetical protein